MFWLAAITRLLPGRGTAGARLLAIIFCLAYQTGATETPRVADEYELKAAFLFNLAKFVRWPAEKFAQEDSPLVIGIRGDEALKRFTHVLQGKTIDKHKVLVQPLGRVEEVRACHILFLGRSEGDHCTEWTTAGKDSGVLTVGETAKFLDQGGMIQFALESGELRLEIHEECARKAGLNIMANALSTLVNKGIAKIRRS